MRKPPPHLVRRRFLAGMGTLLTLPMLESLLPRAARAAAAGGSGPRRLVVVHTPNGRRMEPFTPSTVGANWTLPPMLASLAKVKKSTLVLTKMQHDACIKSRALDKHGNPDLHALGLGTLFTGAKLIGLPDGSPKTATGISMDQIYANSVAGQTPVHSLQLSLVKSEADRTNKGVGFSGVTMRNISYKDASTALDEQDDAKQMFDTYFAGAKNATELAALAARRSQRKSILDNVLAEANALQAKVSQEDARRLDHYFTSVRSLEQQLAATNSASCVAPGDGPATLLRSDVRGQANTMMDLMALAFQCDLTRTISYNFGVGHSHHKYDWVKEGGLMDIIHNLSHFREGGREQEKLAQKALTEAYEISVLARFWEALQAIPEGAGNVLDNSVTLVASEVAYGQDHTYNDTGYLVVGGGGGFIATDRHVVAGKAGSYGNLTELQLAILQGLGVQNKSFGGFDTTRAMTLSA